jgi:hypothetical protein
LAGCDGEGDPEFTTDEIRFNGIEDDSHETFALGKRYNGFKFTKTARNPYDRHVLACLILAKKYFGDAIKVSSDGDNEDLKVEKMILQFSRDGKINLILEN